jgi:hypothetical protein
MKKLKEPEYVVLTIEIGKLGEDLNKFYANGYALDLMNNNIAVLRRMHGSLGIIANFNGDKIGDE